MYTNTMYAIADVLCLFIFLIGSYYTVIGFFSLFGRKHDKSKPGRIRFAAVIPAHNESNVISDLILNIRRCNYPQELISVFVIADECTDSTAALSRKLGARVISRPVSTCKGDALSEAFSVILAEHTYDAVAVFDADNLVDSEFFSVINERLSSGKEAVQGYVDSKNSDSSWISYAHSVWYWITNRLMQTGRAVLGIGCVLDGTGFVLSTELLEKVGWKTTTFAEDAEYTCLLAESGIRIDYAENAVVFDEKPRTLKESVRQRRRWTQGMFDVQSEYTFRLLKHGKLNALMNLWGDVLSSVSFAVLTVSAFVINFGIWQGTVGKITLWIYILFNILIMLLALVKDKKISFKIILNIFGFLIYIISWLPVSFFGIFGRRNGGWYHTKHKGKD